MVRTTAQLGALSCLPFLFACAASQPEAPEADTLDFEFGKPQPAQLVALELPDGCRPGDRLRNPTREDPAIQQRIVYGHRWTFEPQPERVVYRVDAYGRDRRTKLLQVAIADGHQRPVDEFATAAGIRVGDAVGYMDLPYARDRGTMSRDHLSGIKRPGVILATDRERTFLIDRDGKVDSVLWVEDETLMPQVHGVLFRSAFAPVRERLAKQDAAGAKAAMEALRIAAWQRVPAEVEAEAEATWQAIRALAGAQDAAPLAAYQQALAEAQAAIAAAHPFAAIGLYQARAQQLGAMVAKIVDQRPDPTEALLTSLRTAARRHVQDRPSEVPTDLAYRYIGFQMHAWDEASADLVAKARATEQASTYQEAFAAVLAFDQALLRTEHLTAGYGDLYRGVLAKAASRDAESARAARRPTAAVWYDHIAAQLRDSSGHFVPEQYPGGHDAATFAGRLDVYDALSGDEAKVAWVIAQVPNRRHFRGGTVGNGNTRAEQHRNFFLTDLVVARHARELQLADELRARQLHASAAVHELTGAAIAGDLRMTPFDAAEAFAAAPAERASLQRTLQTLAPLLQAVLPPIGPTTTEAQRLVHLLREGECLDWPLVRHLTFCLEPGDLQWHAGIGGHVALVQRGETFVLSARTEPQDPSEDRSYLLRLSGISAETEAESLTLAKEAAAIDVERSALAAQRTLVDARGAALEAEQKAIEAARAGAQASAEVQRSFNARVDAHNGVVREVRPLQEALRAQIAALNGRIAAYNPLVAVNNERRMRERAAGGAKVDALLRTALEQWFTERLGAYEAVLRTAGHDEAAITLELRCARWWLGRETAGVVPSFVGCDLDGHRQLRREAIERTIHQQPTNESLAQAVVEHWVLSRYSRAAGIEFFREWAKTFRWQRDIKFLKAAIAARTDLTVVDHRELETLITASERR